MNSNEWVGFHLYYSPPWEDFLKNCLWPFMQELQKEKLVNKFFFIRYFEKGPHIRLRLDCQNTNSLRNYVCDYFAEYFKKYPSFRDDYSYKMNYDISNWYPNNSIQLIPYIPELDRYGGLAGMTIAEEHFYSSSTVTLLLIHETRGITYQRLLGLALELHFIFLKAFGMDISEINKFSTYDISLYGDTFDKNGQIKKYENSFILQKDLILADLGEIEEIIRLKMSLGNPWMDKWYSDCKRSKEELSALQKQEKLILPKNETLWFLYQSYIHMTNNRLGVKNIDEPFLVYLLYKFSTNI